MNRPSALIEGELAFPDARLLGFLPPPFGLLQRQAQSASQREVQREPQHQPEQETQQETQLQAQQLATVAAQQSLRKVVRHKKLVRQKPLPPDTLFRFFYAVRQPRDYSAHFKAQLTEAAYYLDAGEARAHSSNRDYVLGAVIFVATGIALAWLLIAGATRDVQKIANAKDSALAEEQLSQSRSASAVAPKVVQSKSPAVQSTPHATPPSEPAPMPQVMNLAADSRPSSQAARAAARKPESIRVTAFANEHMPSSKAHTASNKIRQTQAPRRTAMASRHPNPTPSSANQANLNNRLASNRATTPSTQTDWNTHAIPATTTPEQTALINWAAQQQHAPKPTITMRASSIPATQPESSWSTHLTQRRIVDNPSAFDADAHRP
jgi:hypothetical protein